MRPQCPTCETVNDHTTDYCMGCGTALPKDEGFDVGGIVRGVGQRTSIALVAIAAALFRVFLSSPAE